jgi:hypothetical protein
LKRFTDFGFNYGDCVGELIDNSIDAKCSEVKIILHDVQDKEGKHSYFLYVIDDGEGMDMNAFEKFFEMYGDKDNQTLNSLGKKGIGGKVALVNLSQMNETAVISKVEEGEMLFVRVPWNTITEPKSITVQMATRQIEELWETHAINKTRGTVSRLCLPKEVYDCLDDIISDESFEPRNIYTLTCRNYFRFLQKGTKITFRKWTNDDKNTTLVCKPIDPLHWDMTPSKYKKRETLQLFNVPSTGKLVFLKKKNDTYTGFQEREKNITKVDQMSEDDIQKLDMQVELCLEHSYVDASTERTILTSSFEKISKLYVENAGNDKEKKKAKDRIDPVQITLGTHLERNDKETGVLLEPIKKMDGNFDIRKYIVACRHRVSFVCSANNDDIVDRLFKTQINKSKVDCNDIPHIIHKMITQCNKDFHQMIANIFKKDKPEDEIEEIIDSLPMMPENIASQTLDNTVSESDALKNKIPQPSTIIRNIPIKSVLCKEEPINVPQVITPMYDKEERSPSDEEELSSTLSKQPLDNILTQTKVNGYARYTPVSDAVLLEVLLDYCDFLKDNNVVNKLRNLCTTTTVPGHAELAKGLRQLKEHFETLLENE